MSGDFVPDLQSVVKPTPTGDPFMPYERVELYNTVSPTLIATRVVYAFNDVFGIPEVSVRSEFRDLVRKAVDSGVRCSTARALLEGKLPGISVPVTRVRPGKKLQKALYLLDVMETIVQKYLEERDNGSSAVGDSESGTGTGSAGVHSDESPEVLQGEPEPDVRCDREEHGGTGQSVRETGSHQREGKVPVRKRGRPKGSKNRK